MFLWLVTLTFWPQNKWVSRTRREHFYVKFGDISCIGFWDIVRKKQTDRQTNGDKEPYPRDCQSLPSALIIIQFLICGEPNQSQLTSERVDQPNKKLKCVRARVFISWSATYIKAIGLPLDPAEFITELRP